MSTWVRGLEEREVHLLEQLPWLLRELGRNFPSFCLGAAFSLLVVALAIERSLGCTDEARLCCLGLRASLAEEGKFARRAGSIGAASSLSCRGAACSSVLPSLRLSVIPSRCRHCLFTASCSCHRKSSSALACGIPFDCRGSTSLTLIVKRNNPYLHRNASRRHCDSGSRSKRCSLQQREGSFIASADFQYQRGRQCVKL